MNRNEIIEFLNANPSCHLATVEGDQPRVRGLWMYRADDSGLIFHTGSTKDLLRQIRANPKVEVCFKNSESGRQVRVAGTAEVVEDDALKARIAEERPFLKSVMEKYGKEILQVFRVTGCLATWWTMAENLKPKEYVRL